MSTRAHAVPAEVTLRGTAQPPGSFAMKPPRRLFKRIQRDEHSAPGDATGRDTLFRNNEFRIRLLVQRSRDMGNEGDDLVLILDPRDSNGATLFGLLQAIPS